MKKLRSHQNPPEHKDHVCDTTNKIQMRTDQLQCPLPLLLAQYCLQCLSLQCGNMGYQVFERRDTKLALNLTKISILNKKCAPNQN